MANKVPTYQSTGVPAHAVQQSPLDTGGLINMLENFKSEAETQAVAAAERGASSLGSRQGLGAAQEGGDLPLGRVDTAAGQAFNKAARASYMGQLENDIQEVSDEFHRKWKAGDYGEDAEAWSKGYDATVQGLSKGLDGDTRAVYGPRLESISNRTKKMVFDDFQERTRQGQVADVGVALNKVGDDLLGAARDGDLEKIETDMAVYKQYLADGVEGRLFTAPEAAKMHLDMMDNLSAEAYVGDFQDADDQRAYLDKFKEKRPSDLTPEKHEELAADMEKRLKQIETQFSKRDSQRIADAIIAKTDNYAEQRRLAKELSGDNANTREMVESRLSTNKVNVENEKNLTQEALADQTYTNILKGDVLAPEIAADTELEGKTKASLYDYAKKLEKGREIETDWGAYSKLMGMTPAELLEETPLAYRNQLADAEYKQIVGRRTRALEAKASGTEDLDEGTTAQVLSAAISEMGWAGKGSSFSGTGNAAKRGKLHRLAREQINQKAVEIGRALTYQEKTELVNTLLVTGTYDVGAIWDSKMTMLEALETPEAANWKVREVGNVPYTQRAKIEAWLKKQDKEPTDALVLKHYNDFIGVK